MKVILIDDEQLALTYLEHHLLSIGGVEIIGKYTDPFIGAGEVEKNDVDIVFLDIQMPEIQGIQLAEQLLEIKPTLNIVFVTAYEEYAITAFELNALDYILKPINKERLLKTMERVKIQVKKRATKKRSGSEGRQLEDLQLNLLGSVKLTRSSGEEIPLVWRTTKTEQLFLYLLQNRERDVNKNTLTELIWGDVEAKKGIQQLYTAIYNIRKVLGDYAEHFKLNNITNGYILRLEKVNLDVDQFEQFIKQKPKINRETIEDYETIIDLIKGEYLEGFDFIWCHGERQRLILLWMQIYLQMIDWYYENNQLGKAINLCLILQHNYPCEEGPYFYLMKTFDRQDRYSLVEEYYGQLKKQLLEELNEKPSSLIIEWYRNWKCNKASRSAEDL